MADKLTDQKITALYERLSRDDDLAGDSNSVMTQKIMLENFAAQQGFTNCVHYTDDGWSGANFDRPGWKQLIADVEAGKVGAVLVKDMSRVGRDYLQTGFFTEIVFRQHGVRFIAITNNVDSNDEATSEFAPFLNIVNEWYVRDCSRKQRAAYQVRGKAGKPTTHNVIYGYKPDPEDRCNWLIDEEAAAVVRRIFALSIEGYGPGEIARILRDDKVDRPSVYHAKHNYGTYKNSADLSRPYDWSHLTVSSILAKPEYKGCTVNFRTTSLSYKYRKTANNAPEDWLVFENTHEPIVDAETWELAQRVRKTVRRTDSTGIANPLTGIMYCADCGEKMYNHKTVSRAEREGRPADPVSGLYPYDCYECSSYDKSHGRVERVCSVHHILTSSVRSLLLETIRCASEFAINDREEFERRVREASELQQAASAKDTKREIDKASRRVKELDVLIKKLYESYATGKMPEARYETLSAEYEQEQADLIQLIAEKQAVMQEYQNDSENIERFTALAKKYTDFTVLTNAMINEFVDKILVHPPYKDEYGDRAQEIEIYLKFIGKIDIPMPEPTPEELKIERRKRNNRIRARAYYYRKKERKRQEELAAQQAEADATENNTPDEKDVEKDAVDHRPLPDEKTA